MFRIVCDPSSGGTELGLTEITRSGSQIFFVCLVGVWQRNFEPAVCVCVHGTTGSKLLLIQTVLQWRIWFRSSNPPRHPESLTKSNRIAN